MDKKLKDTMEGINWELHPESPVPLYYQLSRILENLIQDEAFQPGDRFPTEENIAACFQVSRPTANKAVQLLLGKDFLSRDKGVGTFVKEKLFMEFSTVNHGLSFADHLPPDVPIRTKVINSKKVPATKKVARALAIDEGAPVFLIRRLRFVYNRPFMVADSQLSADKFTDLLKINFARKSLYNTLREEYNCPIVSSQRFIHATEAVDHKIVKLLDVKPFSSILVLSGVSFTHQKRPIDFLKTYIRQGVVLSSWVYATPPEQAEKA